MELERKLLALCACVFFGFGLVAFFIAEPFAQQLSYDLSRTGATMEFMAAYGGLMFGIGAFLLLCLKQHTRLGLWAVLLTISGLFVGRLIGFIFDDGTTVLQNCFLVFELTAIVIITAVLKRHSNYMNNCLKSA